MPMTYHIDREWNVIRSRIEGELTIAEVRDYWEQLLGDAEAVRIHRNIVDVREARPRYTGVEMLQALRELIPRLGGASWYSALIVERPVHIGIARQFQLMAEQDIPTEIFTDPDEALAWVLAQ